MKSLKQYLTESVRTYNYTIKIAGELPKDFLEMFKYNLNKFAPTEISDPTTTPIQKDPYGFPHLKNVPVTIMKVKFKYPTTEPMVQQVVQLLGFNIDINCVRMIQTDYNDSINAEHDQYQNQIDDGPLLNKLSRSTDDAIEAGKQYSNQYLDNIKAQTEKRGNRPEVQYAGRPTSITNDPFEKQKLDKRSTTSPLSDIHRPGRPKTGSSR